MLPITRGHGCCKRNRGGRSSRIPPPLSSVLEVPTARTGNKALGRRIRNARQGKGITQSALAALVGVAQNSISDFETGAVTPAADTLARIAASLEETVDGLWGRESMAREFEQLDEAILGAIDRKLARKIKSANPKKIKDLAKAFQALAHSMLEPEAPEPPSKRHR